MSHDCPICGSICFCDGCDDADLPAPAFCKCDCEEREDDSDDYSEALDDPKS
jgi:hypothetical protein